MARNISTGIDIGTYQVKVVITEHKHGKDKKFPQIIGTGFSGSRGLSHGYIINSSDIVRSIRSAVRQAEQTANIKVKKAYISISGVGLEEIRSKGDRSHQFRQHQPIDAYCRRKAIRDRLKNRRSDPRWCPQRHCRLRAIESVDQNVVGDRGVEIQRRRQSHNHDAMRRERKRNSRLRTNW